MLLQSLELALVHAKTNGTIVLIICLLTGVVSTFTLSLFESLYYSNRDVKYWVFINNSAVPFFWIAIAAVCQFCLNRFTIE